MPVNPMTFIHATKWGDLPLDVQSRTTDCLLDLIGTAAAGATTPLSKIIRSHAASHFGSNRPVHMLFDSRPVSPAGAALAGGMTIDAIDAHDGFNPVKGHIGCGVFPALLAVAQHVDLTDGQEFLTALAIGYELGGRLGVSLHDSAPDYHTSGAWVALAVAAVSARLLKLTADQTRHAMGIAEYHGPRSQMMRCIDDPTMVKDGSGWGAMAGVSAAFLAQSGFTGAPAITLEGNNVAHHWADLGADWQILQQYFKPYPVCRWAQAPIAGVLQLKQQYDLQSSQVEHIEITTFHESVRLAIKAPRNTEEAQYSTSYPCAAALVRGKVGVAEISPKAFEDPEISRLSKSLVIKEDAQCNKVFPEQRLAKTTLYLNDGGIVSTEYLPPLWDAESPPSIKELRLKFHQLADPVVGPERAGKIDRAVHGLANGTDLTTLQNLLHTAVS